MLKIFKLEELTALKFLRYKFSLFHLFSECHSLSSYTVPNHTLLYFTIFEVKILRLYFNFIYYLWVAKMTTMGKIVFITNQFPCRFYLYLDQEAWHIV